MYDMWIVLCCFSDKKLLERLHIFLYIAVPFCTGNVYHRICPCSLCISYRVLIVFGCVFDLGVCTTLRLLFVMQVRVFSKTGALVWSGCKGVDSASDVCWGPGGEILVAERGSICRVSVWSPDGTVASKHFHLTAPQPLAPTAPTTGTAPSPFTAPILLAGSTPSPEAFALSDSRQLYVLDRFTSRVWVFE